MSCAVPLACNLSSERATLFAFQRAALVLVVLLIAGGLFMFTYKSTQFNVEGFALVLGASFIGGIRWTLTQILLQKADLGEPLWRVGGWANTGQQPRRHNCSCPVSQACRIPSTPCSTCSHSCFWGSSLSLPYLKVRSVFYLPAP